MVQLAADPLPVRCERAGHIISRCDIDVSVVAHVVQRPTQCMSSLSHDAPCRLAFSTNLAERSARRAGPKVPELIARSIQWASCAARSSATAAVSNRDAANLAVPGTRERAVLSELGLTRLRRRSRLEEM